MKKLLYYVTSNNGKFEEVKNFIEENNQNIKLEQFKADITELQTTDQNGIAIDKAKQAWDLLKKPLIVDDSAVYFSHYNNFPGTMTKFVFYGIGYEGIFKLLEDNNNAYFKCNIVYISNDNEYKLFEGKESGKILKTKNFVAHSQLPISNIFFPENSKKSYAQLRKENSSKTSHRLKAIRKLLEWLETNKKN